MTRKSFLLIAGAVFGVVAIAHLLRIALAVPVTIGEWAVPMWVSWPAVLVAGSLSYMGLRSARAG
jgi:hypothetical protein